MNGTIDNKPQFRLGHRPVLDGVRGVSVLAVMFLHGGLFWMGQGGFLGVDIFFVLSGFLITALLLQEMDQTGTVSFKNFYIRRGLRLLPALITVVAVCILGIVLFSTPDQVSAKSKSVLIALFYLSNWLPVYPPLFHTWSLGIEEQFYIVWPLTLFLLLRWKVGFRGVLVILLAGVTAIAINRAILWSHHTDATIVRVYTSLDTRSDTLLIGCMAGIIIGKSMISFGPARVRWLRILAGLSTVVVGCLMFAIAADNSFLYYGGFSLFGLMIALIIASLFHAPIKPLVSLLELPILRWMGRLSYGMYLWHLPVYYLYGHLFGPFPFRSYTLRIMLPFVIKFFAAIAVATLSFYLIEQPALRLKKRFKSSPKFQPAISVPALSMSPEQP